MARPHGVSSGVIGLVLAWLGGAAIARLTGATPVIILLVVGIVMGTLAAFTGWMTLRRTPVLGAQLPAVSTQQTETKITVELGGTRPVFVEVRDHDLVVVGSGWSTVGHLGHTWTGPVTFATRGLMSSLSVRIRSAGASGLVWWAGTVDVPVGEHLVAARPVRGAVFASATISRDDGEALGQLGAAGGDVDGVRPWRDGDSERFVHWASTLRTGELVVHDRRADVAQRWVIRARPGTDDPDHEAGAARSALEEGLRTGASMYAAVGAGEPVEIRSASEAAAWSATAELGVQDAQSSGWRTRPRAKRPSVEPDTTATATSRWWAAVATLTALAMLMTSLDYGPVGLVLVVAGVALGAIVSARSGATEAGPTTFLRLITGLGALVGLIAVVASSGQLSGVLTFLRGPLPKVLIILIVFHGFECRDRRTIRVGAGISAIVVIYASGLRVDDSLLWWLLAWLIAFGMTLVHLAGPTRDSRQISRQRLAMSAGTIAFGLVGSAALLAIVPIPPGPARLTLPTLISDEASPVGRPGAIAGPDGEVRDVPESVTDVPSDRAPAGQAGGYVGFAASMDTSVRGDLSDEIVMRVRAPGADFWRGQTFGDFDGRTWFADDDAGLERRGPNITIPPSLGDLDFADDVIVDEFVQTFHLETDMPNLVFHAYRPDRVILDADLFTRSDGALRASTVLPEGSIYTVVSARPRVDAALLQRQGLIGQRLSDFGRGVLGRYLTVPASTSAETIALANQLAAGRTSTYDVVRSYEAWLADNVEYNLRAPVPDLGENAVDHFLFESQEGFCEQIASALTIMLRTQGVPARLATGYASGTRDPIAGVFEVRASDAHAWVEVWFPETGWQAFDPTASVPLSADSEPGSVGADLASGINAYVDDHTGRLLIVLGLSVVAMLAAGLVRTSWARRRRGRWGVLQDRFVAAAVRRGGAWGAPNPQLAAVWTDDDDAAVARMIAERLDRAAFDPGFVDDRTLYNDTRKLVGSLGGFWQ